MIRGRALVLRTPEDGSSVRATTELMSDPGYHEAVTALQADLARGEPAWAPHHEVERRLREGSNRGDDGDPSLCGRLGLQVSAPQGPGDLVD